MIMQHIFTNTADSGWSTLRISSGLIKYQSILEEISLFHETRGKDEKGMVFYPLRGENLFVIGQSAPFAAERPSYIHHNLVLDEDSFDSIKQNAEWFLTGASFYTNPAQVPDGLPDIDAPIIRGVRFENLPDLNWEIMADALFSGYQSTWRFNKTREEPETLARLILARFIKILPSEIMLRFPGVHTSAFPQISGRIAVRFPYYDSMQSAIRYIDDAGRPARLSFAAACIAEKLRGGVMLNMPRSFTDILNHRQSTFNTLPLIQDLLGFYAAFGESRTEEGLNAFTSLYKNSRSAFCLPVLENIILRYVKSGQQDGEYILRRLKSETPASFARIAKQPGVETVQRKTDAKNESVCLTGESPRVDEEQAGVAAGKREVSENSPDAESIPQMTRDLIFVRDLPALEDWLEYYTSKGSKNKDVEQMALDKYLRLAAYGADEIWLKKPAARDSCPKLNAVLSGAHGKKAVRGAFGRNMLIRETHNFRISFKNSLYVRCICFTLFICAALLALTTVWHWPANVYSRMSGNETTKDAADEFVGGPDAATKAALTAVPDVTAAPLGTLTPAVSPEAAGSAQD
ncbi:MAG: hypothetical protein LBB94_03585 [Clostridiales bacterium]|jgi:hypothetical protein|nr:hypothetical protein [Clostridiales bacterium]